MGSNIKRKIVYLPVHIYEENQNQKFHLNGYLGVQVSRQLTPVCWYATCRLVQTYRIIFSNCVENRYIYGRSARLRLSMAFCDVLNTVSVQSSN